MNLDASFFAPENVWVSFGLKLAATFAIFLLLKWLFERAGRRGPWGQIILPAILSVASLTLISVLFQGGTDASAIVRGIFESSTGTLIATLFFVWKDVDADEILDNNSDNSDD